MHAQNYLQEGRLAGSDDARAAAIHDMFADSSIEAVLCVRGGTGSLRLLERLDYKMITANPKPFVGFSDITVLLHAIRKRCGFVTYHGPMVSNFAKANNDPRVMSDFLCIIGNRRKQSRLHFPDVSVIHQGKTEGLLFGGNVTMLQHLAGTSFDWSGHDAILFIEDVEEPLYKLDRALCHLKLAGKFEGLSAVLVGEMVGMTDADPSIENDRPFGRSLEEIVQEHVPAHVPLAFGFPCGHGSYITTLPVGAQAQITLGVRGVDISFSTHAQ